MPNLTKSLIDKSLSKEKPYRIWDDTIKGFCCEIYPTKKTFSYYYRSPITKKSSYIKIGVYGSITLDEARTQARKFAHTVQVEKIDPRGDKKAKEEEQKVEARQSLSFEKFWQVFTEKYINEKHKATTLKRNSSRIRLYILPFFGKKSLSGIKRRDIIDFKHSMSHIKGNCTKCITLLSTAFNQAELWEYIPTNSNPCRGVPKYPDKKMERFLSTKELSQLEKVLSLRVDSKLTSPYTINALRLIIYTGCRLGEVLSLKWEEVDFEDSCLRLPQSKTGKRTIPLNSSAMKILHNTQKQPGNPYVFCGAKESTHLTSVNYAWLDIRVRAGIPDVRIHDLRHSFASFMIKNGVSLFEVSKLLGHSDIKTTMRYAHLADQELVAITNKGGKMFEANNI